MLVCGKHSKHSFTIPGVLSLLPYCMTVIRLLILPKFKIDYRQTIQPERRQLQRPKMLRLVQR